MHTWSEPLSQGKNSNLELRMFHSFLSPAWSSLFPRGVLRNPVKITENASVAVPVPDKGSNKNNDNNNHNHNNNNNFLLNNDNLLTNS